MMANADGSNTTPVDAWAQLDLGEVKSVTKVRLRQEPMINLPQVYLSTLQMELHGKN